MKTSTLLFRQAFTMLELVFVIVVIGILSYMVASNFNRNSVVEAADQIVSHIRYTEHLAIMDNKFDYNDTTYYRERWFIRFTTDSTGNTHQIYYIMSDQNHNNSINDLTDYATNPVDTNKYLTGYSSITNRTQTLDLTKTYGITSVINNCSPIGGRIFFDELDRPYRDATVPATSASQNRITAKCTIVISDGSNTRTIELSPETGYVRQY